MTLNRAHGHASASRPNNLSMVIYLFGQLLGKIISSLTVLLPVQMRRRLQFCTDVLQYTRSCGLLM